MSSLPKRQHPLQILCPSWHGDAKTPVVDGKYYDRETGELCLAPTYAGYCGPPAVDLIIKGLHDDTSHCTYRSARPFPVEALLVQIMRIVHERKLQIDSLTATPYAIRIILCSEMTVKEFCDVADKMSNDIWDRE